MIKGEKNWEMHTKSCYVKSYSLNSTLENITDTDNSKNE